MEQGKRKMEGRGRIAEGFRNIYYLVIGRGICYYYKNTYISEPLAKLLEARGNFYPGQAQPGTASPLKTSLGHTGNESREKKGGIIGVKPTCNDRDGPCKQGLP